MVLTCHARSSLNTEAGCGPQLGKSVCLLLSGLFCCFPFSSDVFFVAVWAGACFIFAVWAGAWALPKQQKKHAPAQAAKKKQARDSAERVYVFCCLGGMRLFFAVWAGVGVFFLLFARGRACFCCCSGGVHVVFLLFGQDACLGERRVFFAVWARDGSSLTYRSAWLVLKGPNNKKD